VEIRVVDRGPGVADALKEGIFQPFQRGGDAPAGLGVGLGLAVARGLLDVMGGTIGVEDTPGGGLTVWIRLPRAPLAAPAGQDEGERVPPAAPAGGASAAAPVSTAGTASREPAAPAPPRGGPR
jgi:two-component system sensor histidine kinase KdpD